MGDKLEIIISVSKSDDTITVSKCLDPEFDMDVLTEALASLILINSKYTERKPEAVLVAVHKKLANAVTYHDIIKRSE